MRQFRKGGRRVQRRPLRSADHLASLHHSQRERPEVTRLSEPSIARSTETFACWYTCLITHQLQSEIHGKLCHRIPFARGRVGRTRHPEKLLDRRILRQRSVMDRRSDLFLDRGDPSPVGPVPPASLVRVTPQLCPQCHRNSMSAWHHASMPNARDTPPVSRSVESSTIASRADNGRVHATPGYSGCS